MAMWSEILGGLGAAGGGYAQALEKVKMQNLDEKTQREQQAWRDEESRLRTSEEQARIAAQRQRDIIAADRYTAEQLAQADRDAATEDERVLAEQAREAAKQRDFEEARLTLEHRRELVDAAEGQRAPENHAQVSGRGALEITKNKDGSWNPAAAKQYLEEQHQGDVALPELIRGLNYVLVQEQEQAAEASRKQEEIDVGVFALMNQAQQDAWAARGGGAADPQAIDWGARLPTDIVPDSTGVGAIVPDTMGVGAMVPDTMGVGAMVPDTMGVGNLLDGPPPLAFDKSLSGRQRGQSPNWGFRSPIVRRPSAVPLGTVPDTTAVSDLTVSDTTDVSNLSLEESELELARLRRLRVGRQGVGGI